MRTTLEHLDRWISLPEETEDLEFKEAKNQYDNTKLFRYCVALASEGGGKLILGVTDKPRRKVVGTNAFRPPAGIENKILAKLNFRVELEEVHHPDGRVLIFHIPSRPKGTAYNLEGTYLMRSTDETVPMTEDRLRKIFEEGKPDSLKCFAREGCSATEVIQPLDPQSYFDLKRPYPEDRAGVLSRLETAGLIQEDLNGYSITNLAAIEGFSERERPGTWLKLLCASSCQY